MKTNAEKSSTATSAAAMQAAKQPFFAKKGGGDFFAPAVQMKMAVSKPGDKLEQEADRMADNVMRMPSSGKEEKLQRAPDEKLRKKENDKIQKAAVPEEKVQKKEDDKLQKKETEKLQKAPASEEKLLRKGNDRAPSVDANLQSAIQSRSGGGQPLSGDIRSYMEPRFNADFSKVRVHSDQESASLSNQLRARAFTHQNNIFFSRNQYQPGSSEGRQLLAHELTHTIQQGHAVQRSPLVSTTTTPPTVQRLFGIDLDPRSFFASAAAAIPGFTMLTVVIGSNPITGASVDRTPGNILRGAIEMIPVAGALISQALDNHGIFEKVSVWASQQFNTLSDIGSSIRQSIADFISNFDILSPGAMLERGKQLITEPIARIKNFAGNLKDGIVTFIKEAILKPIAAFAKANVPNGYDLLCAVLGKDPISGEPVPQTAENLIAPFMKLIGQEEVWENMKKSNAIGRAWAWFQKALSTVKGFVQELPTLFINAFKTLEIIDIVLIPRAFGKLVGVFGSFAGRFISWAGTAVWNLLEIIFDAVSPGALGYIKKTGSAIKSIFQNPLPFVGNLVKAAKQGFLNFATNIGGHLKAGLIDWLTGSLSGVYIPKALNLAELGKFALSILGITWTQIRGKIVKVLGPNGEKIMQGLETGFDIVVALVKGGPAAAWELIKEKLAELKDTVISGIVGFVTESVVKKAIPKLIAMFIPGAGFISAIISIYDTVMVFVEKISKIIQVVTAFIDSIVTIAAGNITAAANRVESILGGLLSLAISFLAGFLGLGKITDKIKAVIEKIRLKVDKAIDAVIGWIVGKAKALFGKLFGKGNKPDERTMINLTVPFDMHGEGHTIYTKVQNGKLIVEMASSQRSQLLALTLRAKEQTTNKTAVKRLDNVYTKLKSAEEKATFLISDRAKDAEALALADKMTQDAANTLKGIGIEFGIPSLLIIAHKSKFVDATVTGYQIKNEFKSEIRIRFYPSGYEPATRAWKRSFLVTNTDPGNSKNFIDSKGRSEPKTSATIDHQPRVVEHWNSDGKKATQSARASWYSDHNAGHMDIIAKKYNSSDGAEARNMGLIYSPDNIGKGFLGPGEI